MGVRTRGTSCPILVEVAVGEENADPLEGLTCQL